MAQATVIDTDKPYFLRHSLHELYSVPGRVPGNGLLDLPRVRRPVPGASASVKAVRYENLIRVVSPK